MRLNKAGLTRGGRGTRVRLVRSGCGKARLCDACADPDLQPLTILNAWYVMQVHSCRHALYVRSACVHSDRSESVMASRNDFRRTVAGPRPARVSSNFCTPADTDVTLQQQSSRSVLGRVRALSASTRRAS
jgi:hypothetical protein